MRITRAATDVSTAVEDLTRRVDRIEPQAQATMESVKTAADTITMVALAILALVALGTVVKVFGGNR